LRIHFLYNRAHLTNPTQTDERGEMRKLSTLVGFILLALASTARAEDAAPAADKAAASAPAAEKAASKTDSPAAGAEKAVPAADKATDKTPEGEKAAASASASEAAKAAPAEEVAAAPAPATEAVGPRKLQLGLSFLPMSMGKYTYVKTTDPVSEDAYFAYGVSLSAVYEVLPGLLVGLAPQYTLNVRPRSAADGAKQLDVMARVAYAYRLPDGITVFAEALPGYSMIVLKRGAAPKGLVLAVGAGCTMDLSDRAFASVGVGYQVGFQNQAVGPVTVENRTRYLRVALGGGVRF
jgi:hypothetical protein